ncbi:MAG: hypothetical protein LBQ66_12380 [Planctomycetaceae bacterium]|nr:hypothetical protein [Planctomycetaceae bacterium]
MLVGYYWLLLFVNNAGLQLTTPHRHKINLIKPFSNQYHLQHRKFDMSKSILT